MPYPKHPKALNFDVESYAQYRGKSPQNMPLDKWLDQISDCGFTNLICIPSSPDAHCSYLDPYFEVASRTNLDAQYGHKYLPDIDGNSFSGRYLAFLRSASLPIKATTYAEWHDSRLTPWLHFVPMHNSFVDVYGILKYFIGDVKLTSKGELKTKYLAKRMVEEGVGGAIVHIGSTSGQFARKNAIAYPTAKAALYGLVRSLALQLGGHGIRVNTVSPNKVGSPVSQSEEPANRERKNLLDRACTPEDIRQMDAAASGCRMRGFRSWSGAWTKVYVRVGCEARYLWRAVDHEGEALASYVA